MTEIDPDLPEGQPGIYVPIPDEQAAAPPPRRKSIVLPAVMALVSLLAAGAFGALWLIERGDHRTTTGQLSDVRAEIADMERKTGAAQTAFTDAETRLKEAEKSVAAKEAEREKHQPCVNAGQELTQTTNLRELDAAVFLIMERCK